MKKRIIEEKSRLFSVRIVKMVDYLKDNNYTGYLDQIRRSGTSIGANVSEGTFASSTADFINKHSIALKEANETRYWLEVIYAHRQITETQYLSMLSDVEEIIKILVKIIKTSKGIK